MAVCSLRPEVQQQAEDSRDDESIEETRVEASHLASLISSS